MNDERARDALALAEAALAHALRDGVTEAEALVMAEDSALTRFANSEIHQNVAESDVRVNLRFARGKRIGVASSGRTDAEALRRLAEMAGRIASVAEETPDWAGLPVAPPAGTLPGAFADGTAAATPELRADGVRAVIAESYERIHRSNLVGMGVLPLQYLDGQSAASLGLTGEETFSVRGVAAIGAGQVPDEVEVTAIRPDGTVVEFAARLRIDTPAEADYYRHGGILPFVLRQLR